MLGRETRWAVHRAFGRAVTNCYVLGDEELGEAVVVDPGEEAAPWVLETLTRRGARCAAVLLTHGHYDHIFAVPELAAHLDAPVLLHPDDRYLWDNPAAAFGDFPLEAVKAYLGLDADWDPPTERLEDLADGHALKFAGYRLTVRHTPGHTPGSCTFLVDDAGADDPVLLSGDLIFTGSVGRTDFPRGSHEQLLDSIARTVLPLEDRTRVWPGHMEETTVGRERRTNPFLRGLTPPR